MTRMFLPMVLALACSRTTTSTPDDRIHAPHDPSAPSTTLTPVSNTPPHAKLLFCAFGGVGMVPNPLPPGYETSFAIVAVEVDNDGPPLQDVRVHALRLRESPGTKVVSLRRVDRFVVMPPLLPEGPTLGRFAVFLNPEGTTFEGTLPHGRTVLRVRVSLDASPSFMPSACELELDGVMPTAISGKVDGSWPT